MFDLHSNPEALAAEIAALSCEVVLPESLKADFPKRGPVLTSYEDKRRYPRFYLRGPEHKALLHCRPNLAAWDRRIAVWPVYTVTVSRGGVSFLHVEQLFPGERAQCVLSGLTVRVVDVRWCRRLGPKCYEAGARFLEKLSVEELRSLLR